MCDCFQITALYARAECTQFSKWSDRQNQKDYKAQLVSPSIQSILGEAEFSCYAAREWNALPTELKSVFNYFKINFTKSYLFPVNVLNVF